MQLTTEVSIIGGGLSGLSLAFYLQKAGIKYVLIEKQDKPGGVMQTRMRDGFTYETGPNTGILARPEVAELFEALHPFCEMETANPKAENRWILKNGKWIDLPAGIMAGIKTPLFTAGDKLRLLGEPFRKKGNKPMETIAELVRRRLGQSFLDYAVDPFISGIYAGDPHQLVTRYALPKLYNLEQNYGSFIRGAIKKRKEPKTERERKATRKVFAARGGFHRLIKALLAHIPQDAVFFGATDLKVRKNAKGFKAGFKNPDGEPVQISSQFVVTTTGAHALSDLFDFISRDDLKPVSALKYARVVQVIMAFHKWNGPMLNAFGGLIPGREKRDLLGVLFPSSIFDGRAPESGALLSVFLGGVKKPQLFDLPDEDLLKIVEKEMEDLFEVSRSKQAFVEVYRYPHAIPQYDKQSPQRLERIRQLEQMHPGLILAGNIRDGIGIADRIGQAAELASLIKSDKLK